MTTVFGVLVVPGGAHPTPRHTRVVIDLTGTGGEPVQGYDVDDNEIVSHLELTPDTDGVWRIDDLTPTASINRPAGTRWRKRTRVGQRWSEPRYANIPDDDDEVNWADHDSDPPGALATPGSAALVALEEARAIAAEEALEAADLVLTDGLADEIVRATGVEGNLAGVDAALDLRVDELEVPTGPKSMNGQRLTGLADPSSAQDAATRAYVLARIADLTNLSPAELDTFIEVFNRFLADESALSILTTAVAGKQDAAAYLATLAAVAGHAALAAALQAAGLNAAYVALTGDQAVADVKTFASSPVIPTPAPGDNTTKAASTAFVTAAVNALASLVSTDAELATALAGLAALYQGLDADLGEVAGLNPANDDLLQQKAGVWVNRTLAQVASDLRTAVLDAVHAPLLGQWQPGGRYYYPPALVSTTTITCASGALDTVPFVLPSDTPVDRIGCEVTTLAASNYRLGAHDDDGTDGRAGTRLFDAGTVSVATTGTKEIVIAQTLPKGRWWATGLSEGGSPVMRTMRALSTIVGHTVANPSDPLTVTAGYRSTGVATGAMPNPAPAAGAIGGIVIFFRTV